MKAAVYREKNDPPVLQIANVPDPVPGSGEVVVRVKYIGVNPIDYWISSGRYPLRTEYGIVGSECVGTVDSVGEGIDDLDVGDLVSIYPWIHCGQCSYCREGMENICVNGGIVGGLIDGCYAEYIKLPRRNVFKIGEYKDLKYLATAGVSALTALHAVNVAGVNEEDRVLVYGASGNVGMYLLQYCKMRGAYVVGISRHKWILDYGADEQINRDDIKKDLGNRMDFTVVFNPMGGELFTDSIKYMSRRGRLVTFGGLLSMESRLDIAPLYRRELRILGSTGGTLAEFKEVVKDLSQSRVKPKIWRIFKLEDASEALNSLFSEERSGKILISI